MRLIREEEIRERVGVVFDRRRTELGALVPTARVEHIGSTAVPGSLTKGDLDICVLVDAATFGPAARTLAARYEIHQPENWTPTFASFIAPPEDDIETGIQLVVAGSPDEALFIAWRDRLRAHRSLRARYDEVKRRHQTDGADAYRAAKAQMIREASAPGVGS